MGIIMVSLSQSHLWIRIIVSTPTPTLFLQSPSSGSECISNLSDCGFVRHLPPTPILISLQESPATIVDGGKDSHENVSAPKAIINGVVGLEESFDIAQVLCVSFMRFRERIHAVDNVTRPRLSD